MATKNKVNKTKQRTKVKDLPKREADLTAKHARKIKGGHGYQIISAGPDRDVRK